MCIYEASSEKVTAVFLFYFPKNSVVLQRNTTRMMTYSETLSYLYEKLPMFTRIGAVAYKKDLTNTLKLCESLGNPQHHFKSLHIAGTNGKGSTSSMLAAIFQAAGYKTGLYTSPHLRSFTERIRINGKEIEEQAVIDFVQANKANIEAIAPSFFEATVAMAFDYFAKNQVDIAIIEVGLGGRLDSTNIITPELSVITNISYDHMDLLGDTLEAIAGEKAGIIKPGICTIIGEKHPETQAVFTAKAQSVGAPIFFAEDMLSVSQSTPPLFSHQTFEVSQIQSIAETQATFILQPLETPKQCTYRLDLIGKYQKHNLTTVLAAVEVLRKMGWLLGEDAVTTALANVQSLSGLKGRMYVLQYQPLAICDTGHNEAGIQAVMAQILAMRTPEMQLHIVWGMVSDKSHDKVLALLPQDAHYYFVSPNIPRGLPVHEMAEKAAKWQLQGQTYSSVQAGYQAACAAAAEHDLIFVGGSTFVVAEVV